MVFLTEPELMWLWGTGDRNFDCLRVTVSCSPTPLTCTYTAHTMRKLLVCWAKASHPFSPLLPSSQWGSQSNLFLMGKHRHEYMHTHAHTHTSDSGSNSTQCSLHPESQQQHTLGLSRPPGRPPQNPTSTYTQPELLRHTQKPLADTGTQNLPSWPHITASHMDTRCHSLTHAGVRAHTHYSHTHKLFHMCSLRTVMVSHMDTITHSEQSIFHTDIVAPPETQSPQSLSASHIPTPSSGKYTDIHSE